MSLQPPELSSLPLFHRLEGQSVLVLGEGAMAEPKRRLVKRAGAIIIDDAQRALDEGVRIAFIAYEDAKACEAAAINLRCAGMLVNVVDRPDLCDFTTPSILDRNPLLIAVGTGGASAGLAKHIRLRLEQLLPQSLGKLARALFAARPALRKLYPDGAERRQALDSALTQGGALDPFDPDAHLRVEAWVTGGNAPSTNRIAKFTLISADPEDLTIKQARLLGEADTVCSNGPVPPEILARARADAIRFICNKTQCPHAKGSQKTPACVQNDDHMSSNHLTVILKYTPDIRS